MKCLKLQVELLSAATFGRGDGVAGLVDREVEHDADGLPYLRGRTLKGLLAEECANILFALKLQDANKHKQWRKVAIELFGDAGSILEDVGLLRVGDARLPEALRQAIRISLEDSSIRLTPTEVLESLTAIRRQSAMNVYGAPKHKSLRSMRVILRDITFEANLEIKERVGVKNSSLQEDSVALLAACVLAWRRAGTGRNRGRGRLRACLHDQEGNDITETCFNAFREGVS